MDYMKLSKELSYALRHAPWEYELELDEQGWVDISQLLVALHESPGCVTEDDLEHMIAVSEKKARDPYWTNSCTVWSFHSKKYPK